MVIAAIEDWRLDVDLDGIGIANEDLRKAIDISNEDIRNFQ